MKVPVQVEVSKGENPLKVFFNSLRPMILTASDKLTHFRDLWIPRANLNKLS